MHHLRRSRFLVDTRFENDGKELRAVYHTITKAFVLLHADDWSALSGDVSANVDAAAADLLLDQSILVKEDTDETAVFEHWKQQYVHDYSTLKSKVLVTRKCNNRCRYCIIDAEARDMTHETAKLMDRFYMEMIDARQARKVVDDYSGGEMMLNSEVVLESAGRRFFFCKGKSIDYSFGVTTNGTLVKPSVISELKEAGLKTLRVSLAGPASVHDKLRPLRGGGKTYELIMDNLEAVSGMIPIVIECQYDSGSTGYREIPRMLDDLETRRIAVREIVFTPIVRRRQKKSYGNGMGDPAIYFGLVHEARRRGYLKGSAEPSNTCMADFKSRLVFDTDGSIIPCPGLQSGELVYGDVRRGIDFVAHSQILKRNLPDRCLNECELLPICMGGCRLQSVVNGRRFDGFDCQYDLLKLVVEDHLVTRASEAVSMEKHRAEAPKAA